MHAKQKSIDGLSRTPRPDNEPQKNKWVSLGWFGMVLVIGSIAFSSYIVYFGTTGLFAKLFIIPQIVFAGGVLIYKFIK